MRFRQFLSLSLLLFVPSNLFAWRTLEDGLEYRQNRGRQHLFRIDPKRLRPEILLSRDFGASALPVKRMRERSGALLVINGGFFDKNLDSLGLLVQKGKVINPVRNVDWGIFQMRSALPSVIHRKSWTGEGIIMALQSGPRLVIDGSISSLKPNSESHRRSAIGVTKRGKVLMAISETPLPLAAWAESLQREATHVLNLDGGGSSQISVKTENFSLEALGTTGVPNGIGLFRN